VVVVNSALRRRYPVSCALQVGNGVLRGPGRVRFPRDPFDALLARMAAVSFFAAAIWSLRFSERTAPIKHIQRGFASRVAVILGMHGV